MPRVCSGEVCESGRVPNFARSNKIGERHSISAIDESAVSCDNTACLSPLLSGLFPPGVACAELRSAGDPLLLFAGEALYLEQATPERIQEFAAGRLCARRALAEFGFAGCPLLMNGDRRPQWPDAVVGSISHTAGMCGAVVASQRQFRGIGLDMEIVDWVTQEIWPHICTPEEMAGLSVLRELQRSRCAALIFSAKESFYKCQSSTIQQWLEFGDVTLDFPCSTANAGSFSLRPGRRFVSVEHDTAPFTGCFAFHGNHVFTGMALAAV